MQLAWYLLVVEMKPVSLLSNAIWLCLFLVDISIDFLQNISATPRPLDNKTLHVCPNFHWFGGGPGWAEIT